MNFFFILVIGAMIVYLMEGFDFVYPTTKDKSMFFLVTGIGVIVILAINPAVGAILTGILLLYIVFVSIKKWK